MFLVCCSDVQTPEGLAPEARSRKSTKLERMQVILEGHKEKKVWNDGHAGGLRRVGSQASTVISFSAHFN